MGQNYGSWATAALNNSIDNYKLLVISLADGNSSTINTMITNPAHFRTHNAQIVYFLSTGLSGITALCGGNNLGVDSKVMYYYLNGSPTNYKIYLHGYK